MNRRKLVILCAHPPHLDPRIDWIAGHAVETYDTLVLGLHEQPDRDVVSIAAPSGGSYTSETIARNGNNSILGIGYLFYRSFPVSLDLAIMLLLTVFAVPLLLALTIARAVFRALRAVWRRINVLKPIRGTPLVSRVSAAARWAVRTAVPRRAWAFESVLFYLARSSAALAARLQAEERIDVVHANDLETLLAGCVAKRRFGCRLVYDAHEYWPFSDVDATAIESWFWSLAERVLVQHANATFTVSKGLAREMTKAYARQFGVIPNCEPSSGRTAGLEAREVDGKQAVRYLFQGNFAPQRGTEELIAAWAHIDAAAAKLYLRGPDSLYRRKNVRLAEQLGLLNRGVFFLDPVTESELVTAANEFDVGVVPYKPVNLCYKYCCPNKLSQYMHAGLAVLTNALPDVVEIVEQYRCGIAYDSGHPNSIVAAVQRMCEDPQSLTRMKYSAKHWATTVFNWEAQSKALYASYSE